MQIQVTDHVKRAILEMYNFYDGFLSRYNNERSAMESLYSDSSKKDNMPVIETAANSYQAIHAETEYMLVMRPWSRAQMLNRVAADGAIDTDDLISMKEDMQRSIHSAMYASELSRPGDTMGIAVHDVTAMAAVKVIEQLQSEGLALLMNCNESLIESMPWESVADISFREGWIIDPESKRITDLDGNRNDGIAMAVEKRAEEGCLVCMKAISVSNEVSSDFEPG